MADRCPCNHDCRQGRDCPARSNPARIAAETRAIHAARRAGEITPADAEDRLSALIEPRPLYASLLFWRNQ